jgi:dienelactone hydrolase
MHGISDPDVRKEAEFDAPIKSAILYYPQSTTIFRNFEGKIDIPTIFITGDKDAIWASANHGWENKLDEYRSPDLPFILRVYKGAYHAFDNTVFRTKRCRSGGDMEHCFLYDEEAHKKSTEDIKAFLMKYAK